MSSSCWKTFFQITVPGNNPSGLQGLSDKSLIIIVSVSKSGVMWEYLKTPSVGYTVKPHHGSMQLIITGFPRLILLLLGRSPFPDEVCIVGRWCSTPCTEAKETIKSVPIWLIALLCTRYRCPSSGSLPFKSPSFTPPAHPCPPMPPLLPSPFPPPGQFTPFTTTASPPVPPFFLSAAS